MGRQTTTTSQFEYRRQNPTTANLINTGEWVQSILGRLLAVVSTQAQQVECQSLVEPYTNNISGWVRSVSIHPFHKFQQTPISLVGYLLLSWLFLDTIFISHQIQSFCLKTFYCFLLFLVCWSGPGFKLNICFHNDNEYRYCANVFNWDINKRFYHFGLLFMTHSSNILNAQKLETNQIFDDKTLKKNTSR